VYPLKRMVRRVLGVGLLVTLGVLVMSACGGGDGGSAEVYPKTRTLPEPNMDSFLAKPKPYAPGEYVSDEFRPAMSFKLDKGWTNWEPGAHTQPEGFVETRDSISLFTYEERNLERNTGGFSWVEFMVVRKVYEVTDSYEKVTVEPAPDDMVNWLQNHPFLRAQEPEPATVGGEKGVQFDAVVSQTSQYYFGPEGVCQKPCLPLVNSSGLHFSLFERSKARFIVLDDVQGDTVTIGVSAPAEKFDEFMSEVQQVLESIEWKGA
jgi:hypothetical protein